VNSLFISCMQPALSKVNSELIGLHLQKSSPVQTNKDHIDRGIRKYDSPIQNILMTADAQGLSPLVARNLFTQAKHLSDCWTEKLKQILIKNTQNNLQFLGELTKITCTLESIGIKHLCLKGPVLGLELYDSISYRESCDLDILVGIEQTPLAIEALQDIGYTPIEPKSLLSSSKYTSVAKDILLQNSKNGVIVELHWRLAKRGLNSYIDDLEFLWQSKHSYIQYENHQFASLESTDNLIYLCVHGNLHAWSRLSWLCDIDQLIKKADIEWNRIDLASRRNISMRPVFVALLLCRYFFQTDIPPNIAQLAHQDRIAGKLANKILSRSPNSSAKSRQAIVRDNVYVSRTFFRGIKRSAYMGKLIVCPTKRDFLESPHHANSILLLLLMRPFRLIGGRLAPRIRLLSAIFQS